MLELACRGRRLGQEASSLSYPTGSMSHQCRQDCETAGFSLHNQMNVVSLCSDNESNLQLQLFVLLSDMYLEQQLALKLI